MSNVHNSFAHVHASVTLSPSRFCIQEVGLVTEAQYAYPASEQVLGEAGACHLGDQSTATKIVAYEDVPATEGALMKVRLGAPLEGHQRVPTRDLSKM